MGGLWFLMRATVSLAGPTLTLLYPLYASIQALESPRKEDDQQWLTYWMLYSFMEIFELVALNALAWIPIWPFLKLAIVSWLVLPQFEGAAFVYEHIVRKHVQKLKKSGSGFNTRNLDPEVLASTIQENGEEAVGKIRDLNKSEVFESENSEGRASEIQENDEASGMPTDIDKNRPSPAKESQERI